jgi:hypothetical protein
MKAAINLIGVPVAEPYPLYAPFSRNEIAALAAILRADGAGAAIQRDRRSLIRAYAICVR